MCRNGCRDQSVRDSACRTGGCEVAVSNSVGRGGREDGGRMNND